MRTADGYIISKCLNGDSSAFGFLVDKYKGSVYALAYSMLHNFHDAEDVAQEVFIKAYKKLHTLRRYDVFHAWLYAITSNLCKNWIRTRSRRPDQEFIEDQDLETLENPSIDNYREELLYESIHEALNSLPDIYCQALTLFYLGGMKTREIAEFLGTTPATIKYRLTRARAQMKDEMLAMMDTGYEQHRLPASFTFRIVEMVKRIRIQPIPRSAGLPWGLSLAAGIVLTVLGFGSQISLPSFVDAPAASPISVDTKAFKAGEIPVDILRVSGASALTGKQEDGDDGEYGSPDSSDVALASAQDEGDAQMHENTSDKGVIIDPETGVKYTRTRTFTGKRDVIDLVAWPVWLELSPNGKFLLWHKTVIPLDGGEPFDLVDVPAYQRSAWSPDGKKVVFQSGGAIWMIPVSPETGQATGPAKKLLDGDYWYQSCSWAPDSERIVFEWKGKDSPGDICILSVRDGRLTQITDDPGREWEPLWSPDGKAIAYRKGFGIRVIPAEGGSPRNISSDKGRLLSWSPDSEWLVRRMRDGKFRFFRLADGREFDITPPREVGYDFAWSPDGKKMLFYSSSYSYRSALKVVSASGGPPFELGKQLEFWPDPRLWSPDSKMIVTNEWIIPLAGGDPYPFRLDVSVSGKTFPLSLSPDCRKLLFSVRRGENTEDMWVVPVSLKDGRTTGPAAMVFSGRDRRRPYYRAGSWSPDGMKLAITDKKYLWLASADGSKPVQLIETPEHKSRPEWLPGGDMIAYRAYHSEKEQPLMVISAFGGAPRKILDTPDGHAWSPDGKELAFVSERFILAIPIAGGDSRRIVDIEDLGMDKAIGLCWSPDGRRLAFICRRTAEDGYHRIFMASAEGGEVTELAADYAGEIFTLCWSPDGKWISYNFDGNVKRRPEGAIWEADVSELLSEAGVDKKVDHVGKPIKQ